MKVKFLQDATVIESTGDDGGCVEKTLFEEGKTADLETASAERWINRGVAEAVTADKPASNKAARKKARAKAK